ncbi:MAG: heparan-alpha-glucosaminide N-acetyltransferase domain-containing protein [Chitinophagaceae bacterium]
MSSAQRFQALDVFRGITICFMIIVNTSGNGPTTFAPLMHASWHGFTPTDLVFPSFLFAVGNAMSFVMIKWQTKSQAAVVGKILKRTLLIFLLGYLMYWFPFFKLDKAGHMVSFPAAQTRILGVLQRIALCYGIAALLFYYLKPKTVLIISAGLLLLYWGLLVWLGEPGSEFSMTGNVGLQLDKWLMGDAHLYHGEGIAFDPEGWLGILPSIGNVVAGCMVGRFLQQKGNSYETLAKLMLAGAGLVCIAYCWNYALPINKKLWTSSFVLYTVGLDCLILSAIIYVLEFRKWRNWTPFFEVFGRNPLFIYLLSEVGATLLYMIPAGKISLSGWLYKNVFSLAGAYTGALLFAITWMFFCWMIGYILDKKKIYVRV